MHRIRSFAYLLIIFFAKPSLASTVTITMTGTVQSGTDSTGVFVAPNAKLAGMSYKVVFTFDDAMGKQISPTAQVGVLTNGTSNPGTAILYIGNGSFLVGSGSNPYSEVRANVDGNINDDDYSVVATDGYLGEGTDIQGTVYPARGTALGPKSSWEDAFTNSNIRESPSAPYSLSFNIDTGYDPETNRNLYIASGNLSVSSITVSGALPAPPIAKRLGGTGTDKTNRAGRTCGCSGQPSSDGESKIGEPISVSTGNVFHEAIDYSTYGENPLQFVRYYNSLGTSKGLESLSTSLGNNWTSNFDRYLRIGSTSVVAERPDGQQLTFTLNSGTWQSDTDVDATLTQSGSTWTLTDSNDSVETYKQTTGEFFDLILTFGQLNSIASRNGYTQTLNRDSSGVLNSVTDSYGRKLSFTYGSTGMFNTVTTPDGLIITYNVTNISGAGNRLTGVSYSMSPVTSQSFNYALPNFPFLLTSIADENGTTYWSWTYDRSGRGISSKQGDGANLTTVTYNLDGSAVVTSPGGVVDTYTSTMSQNVPKVSQIARAATSTTGAGTETFTYDSYGYIDGRMDWNGNQTTYINNSHGDPTTINEAVGTPAARTTTITYDPTWVHLPKTIETPGLTTDYTYDAWGEVWTRTLTDTTTGTIPYKTGGQKRVWTNTWENALLKSVQSPNGNLTQYGHDGTGALTSIEDALHHVTKITEHTGGGLPHIMLDPNGVTTTLNYDRRQRLTDSTISGTDGSYETLYGHDAAGNLTSITLADGSSLTNTYDTAHRLTQVTDIHGNYTLYTLDALGDRTQTAIYKKDGTLTWQRAGIFDALGRLLVDTEGAGQTLTRTFDGNGNVITVTDGLQHTTTNEYDGLNRLTKSTDAKKGVTVPAYDAHDRITSLTDANKNATTYTRDGFGEAIQQTSPDSGITVFTYDADGNVTQKTDALGIVTKQNFDDLDRPITTTYAAHPAENVTYTYDQTGTGFAFGVGRLTSVSDAAGSLSRAYNERGLLASETRVNGTATLVTGYTYDGANRRASMTYPDGTLITYKRDTAGYISTVLAQPAGSSAPTTLATLTHQPFGPQDGATYGNGVIESWTFDASYRATNITDKLSGTAIQNLGYVYDVANNVQTITDAVNAANSQDFGYDVLNRLTSAASGTGGYGSLGWKYDSVGNRLLQTRGSTTTTYGYVPGTNRLQIIAAVTAHAAVRPYQVRSPKHQTGGDYWANAPPPLPRHIAVNRSTSSRIVSIGPSAIFGWAMLFTGFGGIFALRRRLYSQKLLIFLCVASSLAGSATLLTGCISGSVNKTDSNPAAAIALTGMVHGGQQPVTGATIQLYAVGTTGDGSAATALLRTTVKTGTGGNFNITSDYTCPSPTTQVYLVASGGNPGLSAGTNNAAIAMMAALGPCGSLSASTFILVNEVTTVGSLAALYPYMTAPASLGSGTSDAAQLTSAFAVVGEYTNTATGTAPGPALPSGYYASTIEINTLADIVASCINSTGGTAGDGSACGTLFAAAKPSSGAAPMDTITAMLDILKNPGQNVLTIFGLTPATAPFQPTLATAPASWSLLILPLPLAPTFSVQAGTYAAAQSVSLSSPTGAAIYYTIDGTRPTTNAIRYTGPIAVPVTETINAITAINPYVTSPVASAAYVINATLAGTTVVTNANGNITGIPSADGSSYLTFTYNNANRPDSVSGGPLAATFIYDWTGQRFSKTNGGMPPTIYSYSQDQQVIAENNGGTVTDYVYADGRPIAILQPTAAIAANQMAYVHADRLGTPQSVTNGSGSTVWSTSYQPFGTTDAVTSATTQNLRFPGQLADGETGFSYNINRDYVPNLGRYLETDPDGLTGGMNTYAYTNANPFKATDPVGEQEQGVITAIRTLPRFIIAFPSVAAAVIGFWEDIYGANQELAELASSDADSLQPYWISPNSCTLNNPTGAPQYVGGQQMYAAPFVPNFGEPRNLEGDNPEYPEEIPVPVPRLKDSPYPLPRAPRPIPE